MSESALSEDARAGPDGVDGGSTLVTIEDLFSDLSELTADDSSAETRSEIRDIAHLLAEAHERGLIEPSAPDLRVRDAAEAFVGSVIFASPLLVEDGIVDIADHLFGTTPYGVPVFLIANTCFVVLMTYALIEWTGRDKGETRMLLGVVPVRLVMTLVVSFLVATVLMTVWGRVGGWQSPIEAIARINVLWTVGTLGAALGDILSEGDPAVVTRAGESARSDRRPAPEIVDRIATTDSETGSASALSDSELVDAIHGEFDDLESVVDDSADRREINRIRNQTIQAAFDDEIQKYTSRDIAEAFVGSIFFSSPFLVEDGVFDVAAFFLSFRIGYFPVYFLLNTAFVPVMILALVYWAGPKDVRMSRPIFGVIPRRLVGTAAVSFLTAAALMTMWGRVGGWADPVIALARISVVWTVASFGVALGDILPGESSGTDINDDLAAIARLAVEGGSIDRSRER
jgi:uncharacterized membrane protein